MRRRPKCGGAPAGTTVLTAAGHRPEKGAIVALILLLVVHGSAVAQPVDDLQVIGYESLAAWDRRLQPEIRAVLEAHREDIRAELAASLEARQAAIEGDANAILQHYEKGWKAMGTLVDAVMNVYTSNRESAPPTIFLTLNRQQFQDAMSTLVMRHVKDELRRVEREIRSRPASRSPPDSETGGDEAQNSASSAAPTETKAPYINPRWTPQQIHDYGNSALDSGDVIAAAAYYRRAAELGLIKSQANLGGMYLRGRGVPRDLDQATTWLRKAAAAGNASAMFNLGLLHEEDEQRDLVEARRWYERAAAAGLERARERLASLPAADRGTRTATAVYPSSRTSTAPPANHYPGRSAPSSPGAVSLPCGGHDWPTFDKVIDGNGTPSIMYMGTPVRVGDRIGKWTLRRVDALEEVVVVSDGPTGQAIVAGLRRPRVAPAPSTPASGGNVFDR